MTYTIEKVNKMLIDFEEDEDFIITSFQVRDSRIPRIPYMGFNICLHNELDSPIGGYRVINNVCQNKAEVCEFLNKKGQIYLKNTCVVWLHIPKVADNF